MIIIRNANKEDISIIVKFNTAMAMETESKTLESAIIREGVDAVLNNAALGHYFIAEIDDIPVGQLMITKEWSDWRNGEFWWIQSVYVYPDYRQNNIFKELYNEVLKLAKQSKIVCGVRLYVDKENTIAQNVYSKIGMKESNYIFFEEDWSDV